MKRSIAAVVAMLLAVVMTMAACETDVVEREVRPFEEAEMVVLIPAAAHGWIAAVIYHAERKAEQLLEDGIGSVRILTSPDVASQAFQLEELIDQEVEVVVLFPHSDELSIPAQRVIDAGLPLFVFNRNVHSDFELRLLGCNLQIGGNSARVIGEGLGGSGIVAYLAVPPVGSTSVERVGSFQAVMAEEFPDIELVTMTSSTISIEEGLSVATDMLTANPHVDAVFTIDDSLAIGVLQAVREAGRSDVQFISGCGGAQIFFHSINDTDDIFLFSATYSADMIVDTMALAAEWLHGRRDFSDLFDPDFGQDNVVIIQPEIITRYNVENFFAPGSPW